MKEVTTQLFDFEYLIKNNITYIDKTEYIFKMLNSKNSHIFFISRPRRYGKSLMCTTLRDLFLGKKDLFKDLYIEDKHSFNKSPVFFLDFSEFNLQRYDSFKSDFSKKLTSEANRNGITINIEEPSSMLSEIFSKLKEEPVIIIDEFDSPITSTLSRPDIANDIRICLNSFYKVVKSNSSRLRFMFITGVVKLANLSIFSAMNNLLDISFDPEYAGMFGYTENEIKTYFAEHINSFLQNNGYKTYESKDIFIKKIASYYNGYRFSPDSNIKVYNPVSVGYFFNSNCKFDNYWNKTGVATLAVELAKRYDLLNIATDTISIGTSAFNSFDISLLAENQLSKTSVCVLLYYSGYLTIKDGDNFGLSLGFPNIEISSTFTDSLTSLYTDDNTDVGSMIYEGRKAAALGDTTKLIENIQKFYESCSSEIIRAKYENPYHLIFHMFFVAAGCKAYAEEGTLRGKADDIIDVGNHIYVCELKVDKSADIALKQIKDKKYYEKYLKKRIKVHLLGISFSSSNRLITEWKEETIE